MINKVENGHIIDSFTELILNQNKKVVIVSDGLFHPEMKIRAIEWVIEIEGLDNGYIYGNNITPGPLETQCLH